MPQLVTIYHKNHREGIRIYQSELQAWLDDGGSLNPLAEEKEVTPTKRKAKAEKTEEPSQSSTST